VYIPFSSVTDEADGSEPLKLFNTNVEICSSVTTSEDIKLSEMGNKCSGIAFRLRGKLPFALNLEPTLKGGSVFL
jgi:hypothetical protein